jgi:hypothetical protein
MPDVKKKLEKKGGRKAEKIPNEWYNIFSGFISNG